MLEPNNVVSTIHSAESLQLSRRAFLIDAIEKYVVSVGKKIITVNVPDGQMSIYNSAINAIERTSSTNDIEPFVVGIKVQHEGQAIQLLRWVYYDIEFVIDNRPSGNCGVTGNMENISRAMTNINQYLGILIEFGQPSLTPSDGK
jgi:hypothetical protein